MKRIRLALRFMGKNIIPPFLVFILGVFLVMNVISSQNISPIYQGLIDGDKSAVIAYLLKIKDIPALRSEVVKYANAYGRSVTDEVYKDEMERKSSIVRLEKLLRLNPKSRDVLYALYKLEKQNGRAEEAESYLQRARSIDPRIKE